AVVSDRVPGPRGHAADRVAGGALVEGDAATAVAEEKGARRIGADEVALHRVEVRARAVDGDAVLPVRRAHVARAAAAYRVVFGGVDDRDALTGVAQAGVAGDGHADVVALDDVAASARASARAVDLDPVDGVGGDDVSPGRGRAVDLVVVAPDVDADAVRPRQ